MIGEGVKESLTLDPPRHPQGWRGFAVRDMSDWMDNIEWDHMVNRHDPDYLHYIEDGGTHWGSPPTCRYCGEDIVWTKVSTRWVALDPMHGVHHCEERDQHFAAQALSLLPDLD